MLPRGVPYQSSRWALRGPVRTGGGDVRQAIEGAVGKASDSHPDLSRAPYVLYGVEYIDLVSLAVLPGVVKRQVALALVPRRQARTVVRDSGAEWC